MEHVSVLKESVQKYLGLSGGEVVVDGTLGLGGHSLDILNKIGNGGRLFAFDQDVRNLDFAAKRLDAYSEQVVFINDNFRYLKNRITGEGTESVDAILLDLGLSSPHVDNPDRGFSFMQDGPLDMRFDSSGDLTAAKVLNTYSEEQLVDIFFKYGEEKYARKLADKICQKRLEIEFQSTLQLAEFIESVKPQKRSKKGKSSHPATQIFQALRIEVNDELKALEEVLEQSMEILALGGRLVVMSYHSLEDRIVKKFMKSLFKPPGDGVYSNHGDPYIEMLTKKPVFPSEEEIASNPRSRSAVLRAIKKIRDYPQ
jgi:16S rRNA (cytosine1402-N4)-methyltransferase